MGERWVPVLKGKLDVELVVDQPGSSVLPDQDMQDLLGRLAFLVSGQQFEFPRPNDVFIDRSKVKTAMREHQFGLKFLNVDAFKSSMCTHEA